MTDFTSEDRRMRRELNRALGISRYRTRKETLEQFGPRSSWPKCGARTRQGQPCKAPPARDYRDRDAGWYRPVPSGRCRLHGGLSTGPRTPEGRKRIGEATRTRYVAVMLRRGWVLAPRDVQGQLVARISASSWNATRLALNVTRHDLRRVITGLPLDPRAMERISAGLGFR